MSTIDTNAMLSDDIPTVEVESAENVSTREHLEAVYEKLDEATTPTEQASEPAKAEDEAPEEAPAETTADKPDEIKDDPAAVDTSKAPRMWGAAARDVYASLPEVAKQEIQKRERETDSVLRQTAAEREVAKMAQQTIGPHLEHFRQIGVAPFEAVGELLRLGKTLQTGTPSQKAAVIAQLTHNYKVDLVELEDNLVKTINRPAPAPEFVEMQQRLQNTERQLAQYTNQAEQTEYTKNEAIATAFINDPKNEFVTDVADDMAVLLNTGKAKDYATAYKMACRMNEQVFQTIQKREQEQANRIKAGTASLKGSGPRTTSNAKPTPNTTRAALEQAWDELVSD